jgi:hypothetical protein
VEPQAGRPFSVTFGRKKNQPAGSWTDQRSLTWAELAAILTDHRAGPKEGACIVPATFRKPMRQADLADEIAIAAYDCDCGYTLPEIESKIRKHGLAALVHSSHSHMTTTTRVDQTEFEKRGLTAEEYLIQVKKYLPRVADGAKVLPGDSVDVVIEHNPCPKYRIVLMLNKSWKASDYESQEAANQKWREGYLAGAHHLGLDIADPACAHVNALFFLPRHKPDAPFESCAIEGKDFPIWDLSSAPQEDPPTIEPKPTVKTDRANGDDQDVIGAFNRTFTVESQLEKNGYKKIGHKYLAPASSSKEAGVSVKDGRDFSQHSSDSLFKGGMKGDPGHDAFAIFQILEHRGDVKEAVKAAARLLGMEPKKAGGNGECPEPIWEPEYMKDPLEHTGDKDIVTVVNCRDLCAMQFTDRPIIEGLLGEKESLIIVGQSGIMKSSCAYNIALRAGASSDEGLPIHLFDKFGITRRYTSLFIQSENTAAATQKRIANIIDAAPWLESGLEQVNFASIRNDIRLSGPLTDPKFQAGIFSLLDKTHADILFLDPLISYHNIEENDNAGMRRTLDCLTAICDKVNIAAVVIHHAGKSGTDNAVFAGRGASSIGDWAGNILVLSPGPELRKEDGSRRFVVEVSHRKSRNYEPVENFFLERINGALLVPIHPQQLNPERMKRIKTVIQILEEAGGYIDHKEVLVKEVMKRINKSRGSAQNAINAACEDNLIRIVPLEKKGHGYRLPDYEIAEDDD